MAFKLQQNSKILRNKKNRKFERPAYIKKKKCNILSKDIKKTS